MLRQLFEEWRVKVWSGFMRLTIGIIGGNTPENFSAHVKGEEFADQLWNCQLLKNDFIRNLTNTCLESERRATHVLSWPQLIQGNVFMSATCGSSETQPLKCPILLSIAAAYLTIVFR
jgi:hypothetical protein